MSTFRTATKAAAARLALAMAGAALAAPLAQGQAALQAGALAAGADAKPAKRARAKADMAPPVASAPGGRVELAPQMNLSEGKSTLMHLPYPASRIAVGDPRVADVILLNPSEVYLLGKSVGSTNLILWSRGNDATVIDLAVGIDTAALQASFGQLLGAEKQIKITAAADTLILSGSVSDSVKADQALALANAFVQRSARSGASAGGGAAGGAVAAAPAAPADAAAAPKVVNMLSIAAPQQVMLEVKVAEVSKTLVDQLGASLGVSRTVGSWTYSLLSNLLTNKPGVLDGFNNKNGNFATLDAQKRDGLIKVLAEPTIMAISGQEASFLAGGKIFIPVSQTNSGGVPTITLEEKEFGVAVRFTPTVLDGGRINLKVAPEVSDLNKDGIGITANGISGTAILPSFTTRRATTTVQLFDGQSFAIGGLIKNNVTTNIKALPVLGEVPVLGALFRSSDFQTDRSELVFIITPHLVKPLPPDYKLPTDPYVQPTRSEFFLQGKMEGTPPQAAPATPPAAASGFDVK
ncbi:type II and III secretion system protein family protein [Janthinobacterium fluminis]|uniref:Type II and III secretion system protein family protein n=1 Tax=Janthinobacterium fluminis TaxID=2987524 RepID=A0ABT5K2N5_9BURK|nr:type II and III secretion system protein family protein [Janthinobacterium fluminis]MDC8759249.1 type II and III secretion system protein family protein [Janthinobacterium fluminis]